MPAHLRARARPADRAAGDRHQRQRHPRALSRRAATCRSPPVVPSLSPSMDIQVSSNFERLLFELKGRNGAAVAAAIAALPRRPARCRADDQAWRAARGLFSGHRVDDAETLRHDRRHLSPHRHADRPAHRGRASPRRAPRSPPTRTTARRWSRWRRRIRRSSPTRSSARPGSGRGCRRRSPRSCEKRERVTVLPNDVGAVARFVRAHARRGAAEPGGSMTRRLATLANGLRIVTDRIDTVDTVSLGIWVDVGTRHEPPEINGVAHFLEHMAFKGTERRSARAIAEEIEAVGGHLNAYTSRESTAYYAKVLKEDVAAGARYPRRHPAALDLRPGRARARAHGHPAGNRPGQRHARRHHLRLFPGTRLSRPGDGPAGAGQPRDHPRAVARGGRRPICATITAPRAWCCRRPGNLDHDRLVDLADNAAVGDAGRARRDDRAGALCRRRAPRGAAISNSCTSCSAFPA